MNGKVVFTLDKYGYYTWICKAVETVSGFSQQEIIGTHCLTYIYPEDKKLFEDRFANPVIEEFREDAFRVVDKDGGVVKIISRTIRLPDGSTLGVFDRREKDR